MKIKATGESKLNVSPAEGTMINFMAQSSNSISFLIGTDFENLLIITGCQATLLDKSYIPCFQNTSISFSWQLVPIFCVALKTYGKRKMWWCNCKNWVLVSESWLFLAALITECVPPPPQLVAATNPWFTVQFPKINKPNLLINSAIFSVKICNCISICLAFDF